MFIIIISVKVISSSKNTTGYVYDVDFESQLKNPLIDFSGMGHEHHRHMPNGPRDILGIDRGGFSHHHNLSTSNEDVYQHHHRHSSMYFIYIFLFISSFKIQQFYEMKRFFNNNTPPRFQYRLQIMTTASYIGSRFYYEHSMTLQDCLIALPNSRVWTLIHGPSKVPSLSMYPDNRHSKAQYAIDHDDSMTLCVDTFTTIDEHFGML